jgi:asparagine synthase (glutamine-hydrolysing)
MCGFLAAFGPNIPSLRPRLTDLASLLGHRGPNSTRVYSDPQSLIVFHRLAIQDVSAHSDQPMVDTEGRFILAFNGEIYNYQTLRRSLMSHCQFRTDGDTEVLLNGLVLEGVRFLDRVEGMFALVLWDTERRTILAARDPFGVKPLYFVQGEDSLVFASEPRPLRLLVDDEVCPDDLAEMLVFRHVSNQRSGFRRIRCLRPGHYLTGTYSEHATVTFADPVALFGQRGGDGSDQEWTDRTEQQLQESVQHQTLSDVGYSVQLSGGVDSSLLSVMCERAHRGSLDSYGAHIVDYENDERAYRERVVSSHGLNHQEVEISAIGYADAFPDAIHALDAPSPHYGCVALYLVARAIARTHRVVLTGEGADEMFGGYSRYSRVGEFLSVTQFENEDVPPSRDSVLMACVYTSPDRIYRMFPDLDFSFRHRRELARRFPDTLRQMLTIDTECYLASLLLRQDRVSMAHGVEARVPFVHWPFFRFLNTIPLPQRVGGSTRKDLLKRVALRHLPPDLVTRRKNGLTLPIRAWLEDETSLGRFIPLLTDSDSRLCAYGDRQQIRAFVLEHGSGNVSSGAEGSLLMQLVNVEVWLRSLSNHGASTRC